LIKKSVIKIMTDMREEKKIENPLKYKSSKKKSRLFYVLYIKLLFFTLLITLSVFIRVTWDRPLIKAETLLSYRYIISKTHIWSILIISIWSSSYFAYDCGPLTHEICVRRQPELAGRKFLLLRDDQGRESEL